jgi:phage repressor protein C with HTH and peptisase S24 domain
MRQRQIMFRQASAPPCFNKSPYFGENPDDPLSSLSEEGREKAMDYIKLLHASGLYEKKLATVIPFYRNIDIFANAVSAGTGNFLVDGPKDTVTITDKDLIPENATFGVRITGDSMEPEFEDGQIAWVLQQETVANGEIGENDRFDIFGKVVGKSNVSDIPGYKG